MSDQLQRELRSKRLYQADVHIARRQKIRKNHSIPAVDQPHRLYKSVCLACGNSNCVMCGNPRKFWNEPTIQERRFNQPRLHNEMGSGQDGNAADC